MSDFTVLSLGAGVQSSTLVELVIEKVITPPFDLAIFADTGNEPQAVYYQVAYLAERLRVFGLPLVVVRRGWNGITVDALKGDRFATMPVFVDTGKGRAGQLRRQCTRQYKITPIMREIRSQLVIQGKAKMNTRGAVRVAPNVQVDLWLGISLDEAATRMKNNPLGYITNRFPLVDLKMTREDCHTWLAEKGLPKPPRSSCLVCPYHTNSYWQALRAQGGFEWDSVVEFDQAIRDGLHRIDSPTFLHRSLLPMPQAVDAVDEGEIEACDEGFCFI